MFFFKKNKDKKEYYFGLFLKGDEATGFVFEISDGNFSVLHHHTAQYTNGWENIIQDIDVILSKLETTTRLHLKKVIFFLYSYFIDDSITEIRQPYKNIIKSISHELDLQPLGYIECNEAVAKYLERRDKSPLNVILVEIDKTNVDICIYKGSRKVTSKTISRTLNLIDDLTAVFSEVKSQTLLPSRLVLYDSSDLDDESVKILGHKWDKEIFIQHPRVEVIKRQDLYTELGTIFYSQLLDTKKPKNQTEVNTEVPERTNIPEETPLIPPSAVSSIPEKTDTANSAELMGFTISSDEELPRNTYQTAQYQEQSAPTAFKKPARPFKISFPRLHFKFPKFNIVLISFFVGILLILISLYFIETRFHRAEVTIVLPSKTVAKTIEIPELDTKTATTSSTVEGNASTTGKRDVGEKARGEVTVHNFDDSVKLFAKGTKLQVDGFSFVLDQDVSVASASETLSGDEIVKQAGKTKTSITAEVLGPESNLEKGKRFKIAEEPTSRYFAVNEAALSGGSKKSIRTVAKKDIDDLRKTLLEKGKKQAVDAIKKELQPGTKVLDSLTTATVTNTQASKEVGEESDKVSLSVDVSATYYYFDDSALKNKLAGELKKDLPADFELDTAQLSYVIKNVENNDDAVSAVIDAKETASKKISPDAVAGLIKGKNIGSLNRIIKDATNANSYEIIISTPVPFLKSFTPLIQKNITVITKT